MVPATQIANSAAAVRPFHTLQGSPGKRGYPRHVLSNSSVRMLARQILVLCLWSGIAMALHLSSSAMLKLCRITSSRSS